MSNSELEITIQEVIREINLSSLEDDAKERLLNRLHAVRASGGHSGIVSLALQLGGSPVGSGAPVSAGGAPPPGPGAPPPGPGGLPLLGHAGVSGSDYWLFRLVVFFLGSIALVTVAGSMIIFALGKPTVPDGVIAIGSAAVGALAGLLTPSPRSY